MISCGNCPYLDDCEENDECPFLGRWWLGVENNLFKMRMIRGVKMNKILMWIAIILIGLSGFSIKINSFEFEWLGLLETIIRIFK